MSSEDVRLVVNGVEFSGWVGTTIEMAIDNGADAFSVSAPFDPSLPQVRAAFRPFEYQNVQVFLGEDQLIDGTVDSIVPKTDAGDRSLTVQGRSLPAVLIDCGIDGPLEHSGLALSTIVRQVCRPFGIRVRPDNDTNPIEVARATYGQRAFDYLSSLAGPRNILLFSSSKGELVLSYTRWLADRAPIAKLVEGEGLLLSVSPTFDGTKRFSSYKIATQFAGASDTVGVVADASIKAYRPHLVAAGDSDPDPRRTAARSRAIAIAESMPVTVALSGWRTPAGGVWSKGDAITLLAPGAMIYTETKFSIAGVTLKIDEREGRVADLRLVLPETYSVDQPKAVPWA